MNNPDLESTTEEQTAAVQADAAQAEVVADVEGDAGADQANGSLDAEVQDREDGDAIQEPIVDSAPAVGEEPAGQKVAATDLELEILGEDYLNVGQAIGAISGHPLHCTTLCFLTLKNGYTVMGKSACVDARNYREDIGRQIARTNAVNELWPLLGFRLADKLRST